MIRTPMLASLVVVLVMASAFPASTQSRSSATAVTNALDLYARGNFQLAVDVFTTTTVDNSLVDDFKNATLAWLNVDDPAEQHRRRIAAAALVLELLQAKWVFSDSVHAPPSIHFHGTLAFLTPNSLWDVGQPYQRLLEWACDVLRADVPQPAERTWYDASIAVLEFTGKDALDALDRHLPHAEQRFPDDGRVALARAVAADLRTWPDTRDEEGARTLAKATNVPKLFEQAATRPDVRAEAQVRWGYYELRSNHPDAAISHFDQVEAGEDTFLSCLQHLLRGRALEALGREADAVAEYRLARDAAPHAPTTALALAAALVRENQSFDVTPLVHDAVTAPLSLNFADFDPWLAYGQADARLWLPLMAQLHAAVASPR